VTARQTARVRARVHRQLRAAARALEDLVELGYRVPFEEVGRGDMHHRVAIAAGCVRTVLRDFYAGGLAPSPPPPAD